MQFYDSTNGDGIVDLINDLANTDNNDYTLTRKTRDINSALNRFWLLALEAEGRWQVDDSNQTDYPIITMNLVDQQQDYSFTMDGSSVPNQVLEIQRVSVLDSNGVEQLLTPIDINDVGVAMSEYRKDAGLPVEYDKNATGVFLFPKPSTSDVTLTNGLKVYISRTPSYFVSTDTTKQAGIPRLFDEYLALRPAYQFAFRKNLPQVQVLKQEMMEMEQAIKDFYSRRNRDEKPKITSRGAKYSFR